MDASHQPSATPTDPSARHVLPPSSPYVSNLAALWGVDPKLAAALEATETRPSYTIEGDPADDVALVEGAPVDEKFFYFLHGFGLGQHIEALFDCASEEAVFFVIEPDLVLLRTALERRDFSRLIDSGRVLFVTKLDKGELFVRASAFNGLLVLGCHSVEHGPSVELKPAFHRQMATWTRELQEYSRTGLNTLILNGRRTAENVTRNLGWYAASPGVGRLKDRYKGSPAIIVSAGPSLRKNKDLLKDACGKAVMIAVQTTLQPLLDLGVEPHFVTSLDYHEICTRFFEKLSPHLNTELVAEPKATDRIFQLNPGPVSLLGNDYAEGLLAEMGLNKAKLQAGATVAHLAYYLAEHLGCDPIIFVGQDLGFSDGLCYTPGTSYEDVWRPELSDFCSVEMKQWEQIVRDRPILRQVPDHAGRPMYTEERLFTYLQQFERDFSRTATRIIDATEGGVAKRGAAAMRLADAIRQFCTTPLPPVGNERPRMQWHRTGDVIDCLRRRRDEGARIERIARETLPLLEEIRDHMDDQARVNRAIAKVDVLRSRMDTLGRCYDLIAQLTQYTELQRFEADRQIAAARVKGHDRQRRQVLRDIENVRGMAEAAQEFQQLLDEVIARLASENPHTGATNQKEAA